MVLSEREAERKARLHARDRPQRVEGRGGLLYPGLGENIYRVEHVGSK